MDAEVIAVVVAGVLIMGACVLAGYWGKKDL